MRKHHVRAGNGRFLAGLVIHGGLQGWWIAPVLGNLDEAPLFLGAMLRCGGRSPPLPSDDASW